MPWEARGQPIDAVHLLLTALALTEAGSQLIVADAITYVPPDGQRFHLLVSETTLYTNIGAGGSHALHNDFQRNDVHANTSSAIGGIPGRDNLQLCIANVDGSPAKGEVMSRIPMAFATVKHHPEFEKAGLNAGGGPKVRAGCPSGSDLKTQQLGRRNVTVAGPILTYVFVTSAEDIKGNGLVPCH